MIKDNWEKSTLFIGAILAGSLISYMGNMTATYMWKYWKCDSDATICSWNVWGFVIIIIVAICIFFISYYKWGKALKKENDALKKKLK